MPGPPNRGPKTMVPNYRCCTVIWLTSIANLVKSPVSGLRTQWRFPHFHPQIWQTSKGATTLPNCQSVLPIVLFPMAKWFKILTSRFFSNWGQTPKIYPQPQNIWGQVGVQALVRHRTGVHLQNFCNYVKFLYTSVSKSVTTIYSLITIITLIMDHWVKTIPAWLRCTLRPASNNNNNNRSVDAGYAHAGL